MNRLIPFGLLALIPAALNTSSAALAGVNLLVPICTGDGQVRYARLPGGQKLPSSDDGSCCAKGCHSSSRKRLAGSVGECCEN